MKPRARIVAGALSCFATKGFAGTTIADIELAAGYTPRSGGVYRHFPSKVAILEAVIEHEIDRNRELVETTDPVIEGDRRTVLEATVRRGLAQLDNQADFMKIVFGDLDQFPDLMARVRAELTAAVYQDFADRLQAGHRAGLVPMLDFEAVAVLAIAPVVDFKIKQHLLGFVPLDLSEDRLVETWVATFDTILSMPGEEPKEKSK